MLMDEPIGALDAKLREEMRTELKRLHLENDQTTVYVTHDQVEAMSLADRIAIMNEGVLQQVGSPEDVYQNPANLFVAQFVGSPVMNIAKAKLKANGAHTKVMLAGGAAAFDFPLDLEERIAGAGRPNGDLVLGVRPEGVLVSREQAAGHIPVEAHIIEPLGAYDIVDLKVGSEFLRARTASGFVGKPGDTVWAKLDENQTHFFDSGSGDAIRLEPRS
jgi:multiple sugar transport system ATP-binding protein